MPNGYDPNNPEGEETAPPPDEPSRLKEGTRQLAKQVSEKALTAIKSAVKNIALKNPWVLAVIGIIFVLIIIGGFLLLGLSSGNDPRQGTTQTQEATDTDIIREVLAKAGNTDAFRQLIITKTPEITQALDKIITGIDKLPADKQQFDNTKKLKQLTSDAKALIVKISASTSLEDITKLKSSFGEIVPLYLSTFIANVPSAEIVAKILKYVEEGKIKDSTSSLGASLVPDTKKGLLNEAVLRIMLLLADQYNYTICATKSDHKNGYDDHYYGLAFDICYINGKAANASNPDTQKLMKWIVDNKDNLIEAGKTLNLPKVSFGLMPAYMIGPSKINRWAVKNGVNKSGFQWAGHENHIHIGYYNY